ncbi:MAG: translation initiation factor IF-2 [Sulfuricurvum sp.]|uniref:translation initiation factor IF-2 n=1 Tax=Sulfuricurvum sp. TaxID=2025608 RepID=UPI002605440B|nr:translation initiation factor IF-2 [Sulfuricurvum sp.]MDD2368389.1 translation initiation factor IF-2 [Sulfuricurvum sp.]MDD2949377.1 translation initiation factor IF-2 [Sulfuricurvum sp.]MDD5118289.1 translation initiation factor IF-2 [Sulfuricurvum sp.]
MMDKVRVHEIAKELGINSKEVVDKAAAMGLNVKTASSSVSIEEAEQIMNYIMSGASTENTAPKSSTKSASVDEVPADVTPVEEKVQAAAPAVEIKSEVSAEVVVVEEAPKRSGLKIVKKKRPVEEEIVVAPVRHESTHVSSYGKLSEQAQRELEAKRAKKAQSNSGPVQKKDQGVRLDIFGGGISDISMDYEEDQVVLMDFNDLGAKVEPEEEQKPKEKKPIGRNAGKKQGANRNKPRQVSREARKRYTKDAKEDEVITHVEIAEDVRVYEFAEKVGQSISAVIKVLFDLGMMVTKNDFLGKDEIEILASEFGVEVTTVDPKDAFNLETAYDEAHEDSEGAVERPPVITIMGHVDHGKTSLLDAIRNAKVAHGEAGGITQHIGAYSVEQKGKLITFLDTPGHEAFSAMRSRGAQLTDIIVIVVAADDGVKPQTRESVKHAQDAKVPVIVAVNKMDKPGANPDMVKAQMAELGLNPIEWGGDVEFVGVSAKAMTGIDELLEAILLQSEVMELKANPTVMAKAVVVESTLEKGRGPVATVIVQNGTLHVGDNIVCGGAYGRVRALINDRKAQLQQIGPSQTAVVVGLSDVPPSGEVMMAMESDREAREVAQKRAEYDRHRELSLSTKASFDDLTSLIAEGRIKALKVVLKTDVHGSLEAIKSALAELRNEEVKVEVISSGVGGITENDVALVNNSENCALLGFNVRPTGNVNAMAKQMGVEIKTYSIIYQLIDDVKLLLGGMMAPQFREENTGQAEVRDTFPMPRGTGTIAGCVVVDGKLVRGGMVRVIREGVVIHEGDLTSLRRFKDDVKEVGKGLDCGVVLNGYTDVKVGDVIETFKKIETKVTL